MGVNSWPTLIKIFKKLHDQHVTKNIYILNDIILNVKEVVKTIM